MWATKASEKTTRSVELTNKGEEGSWPTVTLCHWTVNPQWLLLPGTGTVVHLIGLGFPVKSELLLINQSNEKSNFENLAVQKNSGINF